MTAGTILGLLTMTAVAFTAVGFMAGHASGIYAANKAQQEETLAALNPTAEPVVIPPDDFWHTRLGERIDRLAVWLGRFEPTFWVDFPAHRHVVDDLPRWAWPTGVWEARVAARLDAQRICREQEIDDEIAALIDAQEVRA
jgi:hypothetical protein